MAVAWALGLAISGAAGAAQRPLLEVLPDGVLALRRLPEILQQEAIAAQVGGGLTTSFVFRVDIAEATGRDAPGVAARVDVRYELWDEVFHVAVVDLAGLRRLVVADRGQLGEWWRDLELRLVGASADPVPPSGAVAPGARPTARVRLEVLPFSQAEREETQRWFSQSLEGSRSTSAEQVGESAEEGSGGLGQTLGLLMATSIERRAVASFDWRLPILRRGARATP